jgi:DNA-binding transcriptional regulator YiaG
MLADSEPRKVRLQNSSRFCIKQRYPTKLQWQMLKKLQDNLMELETFTERWKVSHKQLAQICFCSVDTVDTWFVESKNRQPTLHHKFFLGLTNKL